MEKIIKASETMENEISQILEIYGECGYLVKYWETEDDRKKGNSTIYRNNMKLRDAIKEAQRIKDLNSYAAVEILTNDEEDPIFYYGTYGTRVMKHFFMHQ